MDSKNYTQVLIDGKIYTLGGSEDEGYLQRAASYVNEKVNTLRRIPGFTKQSVEYQTVMAELNMADDYFKAMEHSREVEHQRDELERETYSLKHELVSTQMKLEVVLKDLEERQRELEELTREKHRLERKLRGAAKNRGDQEAAASALRVRDESSEKNSSGRESGHTSPVKAGDKGDDDDDGAGHGEARFVAEAEDWEVESAGEEQAEDAEEPEKIELADDVEESEEIGESEDVEKSEEIELADDVEELEFAVTGERAEVLEPETAGAEDTASDLPEAQSDKAKSTAAELPESIRPVLAGAEAAVSGLPEASKPEPAAPVVSELPETEPSESELQTAAAAISAPTESVNLETVPSAEAVSETPPVKESQAELARKALKAAKAARKRKRR
ncbi:cell division protein ZapA [Enterocloster lavalensis]|uniref:cell division protein ZapA n=1 Tax=Enterocloster lavalensis TaxID=460384 RepID=UPI001D084A55|nr:cell division protein ZapA [Enterocloster lavalensis]MCB6345205.1 cell division protein ZapA [Enterocloster lavalensis]